MAYLRAVDLAIHAALAFSSSVLISHVYRASFVVVIFRDSGID